MKFLYKVFGLTGESEIELPAFYKLIENSPAQFSIQVTNHLPEFKYPILHSESFCRMNENEFEYRVEGIANYFVKDGRCIMIQPLGEDWSSILLYLYSNCMAALLIQRDLIPFHVSGIIDPIGGVWLFAAPSGVGKSTIAIKLKERGFDIFTDDTALIFMKGGNCMAIPSYPMIKVWKSSLENQSVFSENEAAQIRADVEKFGIFYHNDFKDEPKKINGIIFIEEKGDDVLIEQISGIQGMQRLRDNVYRGEWVTRMRKDKSQFQLLSAIAKSVHFWSAKRPVFTPSFDLFSDAIDNQIIKKK